MTICRNHANVASTSGFASQDGAERLEPYAAENQESNEEGKTYSNEGKSSTLPAARFTKFRDSLEDFFGADQPVGSTRGIRRKLVVDKRQQFVMDVEYMERHFEKFQKVAWHFFMRNILPQLESGIGDEYFRQSNFAMAAVLKAVGFGLTLVPPAKRTQFAKRIWISYLRQGLPITTDLYNILLSVFVENGHDFDPWGALLELKRLGHQPNVDTYIMVAVAYCVQGDSKEAFDIIAKGREAGFELDPSILNKAMLYSHVYTNNVQEARKLLQAIKESGMKVNISEAYGSMSRAAAARGDIQQLMDVFQQMQKTDISLDVDSVLKAYEIVAKFSHVSTENLQMVLDQLARCQVKVGLILKATTVIDQLIGEGHFVAAFELLRWLTRIQDVVGSDLVGELCMRFVNFMVIRYHLPKEDILHFCSSLEEIFQFKKGVLLSGAIRPAIEGSVYDFETNCCFIEALADELDPERKRPHIMFPLIFAAKRFIGSTDSTDRPNLEKSAKMQRVLELYFSKGYKLPEKHYDQQNLICYSLQTLCLTMNKKELGLFLGKYLEKETVKELFGEYVAAEFTDRHGKRVVRIKQLTKGHFF